jgi:hypothetical protein
MVSILMVIPLQLLKDKIDKSLFYMLPFCFGALAGWVIASYYDRVVSVFFPQTIFCIGKQQEFYENKKKLRQNWRWGIFVAFLISLGASMIAFFITKYI